MKLEKFLNEARHKLKASKINSYILDANLLLCAALNVEYEYIVANYNIDLSEKQILDFNKLLDRRLKREPISHILGVREFWSLPFKVNKFVLDPRPDSEILVEQAINIIGDKKFNILDLGTASGCLILSILYECKNAKALAVDISQDALNVAKENAKNLKLDNRCEFIKSNWTENLPNIKFDLIISNPPYIKTKDINNLESEVKDYEPIKALDGGDDGLDEYRRLAKLLPNFLNNNGQVILEHGINQEDEIIDIFTKYGFTFVEKLKDLSGINRCLVFIPAKDI